jgi:multidrug efflux pump subunit AcrB
MTILKNGGASTLDVVASVREMIPQALAKLPKEFKASLLFDQSLFVRAAISGVVYEGLIAAALTGLMILFFLGSWRSTLIVTLSIPLSILTSIIVLTALGQTLNVMTLGGLALAVGILVDDATVELENVHRNFAQRKPFVRAILDGAQQIALPAFVSTLCICVVFVPVAFLTGVARSLFVPLALAVVFAMLTSYLLSRTLVPTLVFFLLRKEAELHGASAAHARPGPLGRLTASFGRAFERLRASYAGWLSGALSRRGSFIALYSSFVLASVALFPLLGRDFFPSVDAGLIKLHVRGAPGTRIEQSEADFARIESAIREVIPERELATLIDNIGVPTSGINLSLSEGALISSADGQFMIALKQGHRPTSGYVRALRAELNRRFPDKTFFFLAPDISTQVLNFGLAAPITVQVVGPIGQDAQTYALARRIAARTRGVPGAVDVHLAQVPYAPQLRVNVDRAMASRAGLSQHDVASDLLVSLSSSGQVAPNYWLDKRGVQYLVAVQTPQYRNDSLLALDRTPLSTSSAQPQLLSNVGGIMRADGPVNITHYNVARTFDVQCNVEGTDLGSVVDAVQAIVDELTPQLPRGTTLKILGQAASMESSFHGLALGLIFAVVLVYLLMVVNFQSWLDPLVILTALPGALAGIAWMLFLSHTTVSVPVLMGAIMCIGVATANSILVVTFASAERARSGLDATSAALAAGSARLRPVLMTALAMIVGMLPMSLGLGEGGEQNAPLGRAVIGGLSLATLTTLFFVPVMYSILRKRAPAPMDPELEMLS